ncbi:MAG: DinB family protein [Candidatus Dormibacteria bacterium]
MARKQEIRLSLPGARIGAADFSRARLEEADFSSARIHGSSFEGAKITDASFENADISAEIEGLRLNGVEVAPLVEAELDRLLPERTKLRASNPAGLAEAWEMVEGIWRGTVERARALPEPLLNQQVDEEWSFVETLRHMIFAIDSWLGRMIRQQDHPFHPFGIAGPWLQDPGGLGLNVEASPSSSEVLEVFWERIAEVRATIASVTPGELERVCEPPAVPGHPNRTEPVGQCLRVILNEAWLHSRYANRDLDLLSSGSS